MEIGKQNSALGHEEFFANNGASEGEAAAADQEMIAPGPSGLTSPLQGVAGSRVQRDPEDPTFIVVTHGKRACVVDPPKEGNGPHRPTPSPPQLTASVTNKEAVPAEAGTPRWKDPFGASDISSELNPVTMARVTPARTKQCARRVTGTRWLKPKSLTPKSRTSQTSSSSGSASDRSRSRLWHNGCVQDAQCGDVVPKRLANKAKKAEDPGSQSDGWRTATTDNSDSENRSERGPTPPRVNQPSGDSAPVKGSMVTGRFNGRVHPTPGNGLCGPASVWAALTHLSHTKRYGLLIPEDELALRHDIADFIRDNLDVRAAPIVTGLGERTTWRECIAAEYFPEDPDSPNRQGIWCPDVDATQQVYMENVEDYLAAIVLPHTFMDEFMMMAVANMWEVRVAVFRYEGRQLTSENSQFVTEAPIAADRTIYLVHSGNHFEWMHGNDAPCGHRRCHQFKRISAAHIPYHLPADEEAARVREIEDALRKLQPAATNLKARGGAKEVQGGTHDAELQLLIRQLLDEYPELSPERADAALKLTKQNGKYNLYRAARVLPGREGAPITLHDSPGDNAGKGIVQRPARKGEAKVYFASSESEDDDDFVEPGAQLPLKIHDRDGPETEATPCKASKYEYSSGGDDETDDHRQDLGKRSGSHLRQITQKKTQDNSDQQGGHQQRGGCEVLEDGGVAQVERPAERSDAQGCSRQGCVDGRRPAERPDEDYHRNTPREEQENPTLRFAMQVASVATGKTLQDVKEVLLKNIAVHGDMAVATMRTCQELMDGPQKRRKTAVVPENTLENAEVTLAERQFGADARAPTVRTMARRALNASSEGSDDEGEPHALPKPMKLFDQKLNAHIRNVGSGLTAGQRLATAVRRTEQELFRDAQNAQRASQQRLQQDLEDTPGATPESAIHALSTTMGATARQQQLPAVKSKASLHASPGVRVAEQMRIKREQVREGQGAVVVVNSSSTRLPTWKAGPESEGKGFNWKTKQKMVHAWEQYQLSEGLHAPKSFKSMIDPDLVPGVCAECNLEEGDWEMLDDVALLSAIEERLKPHDAMDFTVQLKQITFDADEAKGTLTQRYRLFAEPFLAKVSEAKAAGFKLQENVVKLAFSRAVASDAILQGWLEQEKWVSAAETHRRITNNLKMVDAYQALAGTMITQKKGGDKPAQQQQPQQQQQQQQQPQQQQHQPAQQQQQGAYQQQQQHQQNSASAGQGRGARFTHQVQAAVNNAMLSFQQALLQQQQLNGGGGQAAGGSAMVNVAGQFNAPRAPFPGLDARGPSWHIASQLLTCRQANCTAPFCQACGLHGHTTETCRKLQYNDPGVNRSGYWSEQKPGCPPLRAPPRAPVAAVNAFPTPYVMHNGGGAAASAAPAQGAANVNHASTQVQASNQSQQPPAPNGANSAQ